LPPAAWRCVDNRQHLPDALQPEVFLHLTESLAQTVTRIRVPRNRRLDKPLLLMHITVAWPAMR
jgi:Fe-S cluster assembly protein SufD